MEKFLLFTTGGGSSDPLNWDSSEAALYSVKDLKSIKPISARELDLTFNTNNDIEIVTLKIKNGLHSRVISAIGTVIGTPGNSVIAIADVDGGRYINSNICGVTIRKSVSTVQSLSGTTHVKLNLERTPSSITLSAPAAAVLSMWLTDITGSDIQDTGVNLNYGSGYAVTTSSQAVVVDGTSATNDLLLNEKIWKSDGTLFGICTVVGSTTGLTFGGGLSSALANADDLYTGNRYKILERITIPTGATLKLDSNEINFPLHKYNMFAQLASGTIDIIARY